MNDDQKKQQEEDYLKWSQEQKRERERKEHERLVEEVMREVSEARTPSGHLPRGFSVRLMVRN